jgi:putative ABC transport system permease protein
MATLIQDVRYGFRILVKNPGFTSVAVLSLALGIGANTAVFSLTDQILLRTLPVRRPSELVVLRMEGPKRGRVESDIDDGAQSFSYPFYRDLREENTCFSGLLARFPIPLSVAGQGRTERAAGELVSGNYFEVLGVRPALGRLLTPEDDAAPGGSAVAVLSHGYWTRRFGASPAALNQSLVVNGHTLTVVGVTAVTFGGVQVGQAPDLFVPMQMKAQMTPNWDGMNDRKDYWLQMIGRLRPGFTAASAQASLLSVVPPLLERDLAALSPLPAAVRDRFLARKMLLVPGGRGRQVLQLDARDGLLFLSALVALVLLIASANVASLLLARGVARRREIALRLALGARRGHLLRQLMTESLLLGLAGGILGLLIAAWCVDALVATFPQTPGMAGLNANLDARLLAFNLGAALLTTLAFGLIPALRATRPDLITALKEQGAGTGTGVGQVRLRKGLVVAQIAVTTILLITAGLFTLNLRRLEQVDLGIRADNLLTLSIDPQLSGYSPERTAALVDLLRADLASLPGVTSVTAAQIAVLGGGDESSNATIEGFDPQGDDDPHPDKNSVGPRYFATLGIPLLSGREISDSDTSAGPKVAVINATLARKYFAGRDPLGRHLAFARGPNVKLDIEIVGVVKDSKHSSVREEDRPFVYLPYSQKPDLGEATFYLRSALPPQALAASAREAVHRRDAGLPVYDVKTLVGQRDESLYNERMLMGLSICFGLLAALLASIGLYGVMAYTVACRTPEIGIRMALGASLGSVRALVLREAMTLAGIGLAIGIPAALATGRLARSLLYGVAPGDPRLVAAASLLLIGVMLAAAYLPARRATRVNPMVALRSE